MTIIINTEHNLILYSEDSNIKEVMLFITSIPKWETYEIVATRVEGAISKPPEFEEFKGMIPSFDEKGES